MTRAFILIDALPGQEDVVLVGLDKVAGVVSKRSLNQKVGSADIVALVEAADTDAIDKIMSGRLRGLTGVYTVQRLKPGETQGMLSSLLAQMEKEAGAR